jgi:hypothetical protein
MLPGFCFPFPYEIAIEIQNEELIRYIQKHKGRERITKITKKAKKVTKEKEVRKAKKKKSFTI